MDWCFCCPISSCCGRAAPEHLTNIGPVTGRVTLDGQPLSDATVIFDPREEGGETAVGTTDADGTYELTTIVVGHGPQQGAVPGNYHVIITKIVMPDGSPIPRDMSDADAEAEGARQVVPPRYSDSANVTLVRDVPEDGGTIDFEL